MTLDTQLNDEELKKIINDFKNKVMFDFIGKKFLLVQYEFSPAFIGDYFNVKMIFKELKI